MRADARKNYDLLIEVARDVFVEQGAEASLRDIARRAGVGMGTLYRHFPNRDSLLEALLRSRFAALTARAESLLLAADPAAALLEWLAESVAFTHQHRGIIAPLMSAIDDPESALLPCAPPVRRCLPARSRPGWHGQISAERSCSI
ncbi:transcriptional regulator, TetR family [Klebsiella pneumoniae UHKPC81]|nr:transcriptional regulator, TetR family [Klebsiella pneumoniae UHKPC81]